MLLLASFWGASYMFIEIGLRDLSPAAIAFTRIALASAVLAPIAWHQGAFKDLRGRGRWLVVTAAVQVAAPFWLIAAGQQEVWQEAAKESAHDAAEEARCAEEASGWEATRRSLCSALELIDALEA